MSGFALETAMKIALAERMQINGRRETFTASIFHLESSGGGRFFLKVLKDNASAPIERAFLWELAFYRNVQSSLPADLSLECQAQSSADSAERPYLLLLDVTSTHVPLEWPSPPTATQIRQAVIAIAHLHAATPKAHISGMVESLVGARALGTPGQETAVEEFIGYMRDRMHHSHVRALEAINQIATVTPECEPRLLQGDAHYWNALYASGHKQALLIDWQDWGIGLPSHDLGYLLSLQLSPTLCPSNFREVLFRTYLDAWTDFGGGELNHGALWANILTRGLQRAVETIAWQWSIGLSPVIWTRTLSILSQLPEYRKIAREYE